MCLGVREVTAELTSAAWKSDLRETEAIFANSITGCLLGIRVGLYVLYFENMGKAVYDKNRSWSSGGKGKMVIAADGASLKPGKFEGGFIRRRHQDADHMHRQRGDIFGKTFRECLKLAYVLDLTARPQLVRKSEKKLRARLKPAIEECWGGLAEDATWRGDWRLLGKRIMLADLRARLPRILEASAS